MGISRAEVIDLISQLNEYVNEIAGGFTLFLHQDASADIGGYLLLATADPDDVKTDVGPFAITGADQELEQFATATGEPGLTTLQHGVYELHFHAEKTAGTKDTEVYFKIYKRAAAGAETLLGTSEVTSAIGSGESEYSIHTSITEQILLVDDRIVLKLFGSPVGLGSNPTISIYVEGTTLSRLTIPVGIGAIGGGKDWHSIAPESNDYDIQAGDLTDNLNWNDVDFSGHITAGTTRIAIRLQFSDNAGGSYCQIRDNGFANAWQTSIFKHPVANQFMGYYVEIELDGNGKCEMQFSPKPTDWSYIRIVVLFEWR